MTAQPVAASGPDLFPALRQREFARLDRAGEVYLDYTGAALYPDSLVRRGARTLADGVLGNPHSDNPASARSTEAIAAAREAVLAFFDGDPGEHAVVFTANATAACRLVAESFPFTTGSRLLLTTDNHNSVNGVREFAHRHGADVRYLPLDDELRVAAGPLPTPGAAPSLFALPAQSNFSGVRHPAALVGAARAAGWRVFVDAAALVPTHPLSLRDVAADFVCVSFYKMFGWPTGVGALLARREALRELQRPWFAGGTVEYVSVQHGRHQFFPGPEAFEDGTPPFLAIAAVPDGLAFLRELGMMRIRERMTGLTKRLLDALPPWVRVYGPRSTNGRGATVALNVRDRAGRWIPYWEVERAAAARGISVRGGCFCNPGAAEAAFGFDPGRTASCLDALPPGAFTPQRLAACLDGGPVGAVRVSLGIPTVARDLDRFLAFLHHLHQEALR